MENIEDITILEQKSQMLVAARASKEEALLAGKAAGILIDHAIRNKTTETAFYYLDIALILSSDMNLGTEPVLAILLKELLEKGAITAEKVDAEFGQQVRELITGMQKIEKLDTSKYTSNSENFIKLLLTISEDVRVILIRLGQRLHDLRTLQRYPPEMQKKIVGEINVLYNPIAHRIGLYSIKTEMEDLAMHFSEPEIYRELAQKVKETQKVRDVYTKGFIKPIGELLEKNGFDCEVKSRTKSIPSIRKKMLVQKVEFDKVYDLFAIRIIINNVVENETADCWKVYSLITDIYTPNPRRLRDWISFPKATGYESLHTTVIGPEGRWVEVQIRTRRMDDIAEKSVAAHWKYKSGDKKGGRAEFYAAIRELLEQPENAKPEKQTTREKRELYSDEIFVFTPKGDLKKLTAGYTILDFAFEIHSEIGSTCTGAIVNGVMVPLKHVLKNGDTVKIITSRSQKPSHNWLEFVKSPRVISRIKHALKMETYKEADNGKEIIRNKVVQLGLEFTDLVTHKLVDAFSCENILDLYQKFGEGKLDPLKIKKALAEPEKEEIHAVPKKEEDFPGRVSDVLSGKEDFILIDKGINFIHYQFAKCCNPIPGDKIFAFVSVSQGIRIHKTNCPNAKDLVTRYGYRVMEARWKEFDAEKSFTAYLSISGNNKGNILEILSDFLTREL